MREDGAMANYLILDGLANGTWRLPAEADPEMVKNLIVNAVKTESILSIEVEMNDDPRSRTQLFINGRALAQWAVITQDAGT